MIRGCPNGETRHGEPVSPYAESIGIRGETGGTETSKYPEEEKENIDSLSSGERRGKSPNHRDVIGGSRFRGGVVGPGGGLCRVCAP